MFLSFSELNQTQAVAEAKQRLDIANLHSQQSKQHWAYRQIWSEALVNFECNDAGRKRLLGVCLADLGLKLNPNDPWDTKTWDEINSTFNNFDTFFESDCMVEDISTNKRINPFEDDRTAKK